MLRAPARSRSRLQRRRRQRPLPEPPASPQQEEYPKGQRHSRHQRRELLADQCDSRDNSREPGESSFVRIFKRPGDDAAPPRSGRELESPSSAREALSLLPRERSPLGRRRKRSRTVEEEYEEDLYSDECDGECNAREADDDDPEFLDRYWVTHSDCAKIIGRKGGTMRQIEEDTGVGMKVMREEGMDPQSKERYVDIVGTRRQRRKALAMMLELTLFCHNGQGKVLKDERRAAAEDSQKALDALVVEVLVDEVGKVLGRGGETAKRLEKDSGAKLEVEKNTGKVELFGSHEAQELCLELLLEKVSFVKAQDGSILKDERKAGGAQAKEAERDPDEPPPEKLFVRDRDAGRIIGRGGETVRSIVEKSGGDIKVQRNESGKNGGAPREISIFGDEEERAKAKELILELVSWCEDAEGKILKEPPPEVGVRRSKPHGDEDDLEGTHKKEVEKQRPHGAKSRKGSGWVCSQCGGDHRSKDCPNAAGMMGLAMQMGMQMSMQAMGMPGMMGMMGGPGMMGMAGPRPLMPGVPPMVAGMPGALPGMAGLPFLPGMRKMKKHKKRKALRNDLPSDSEASSNAEVARGPQTAAALAVGAGTRPTASADEPRARRRRHAAVSGSHGEEGFALLPSGHTTDSQRPRPTQVQDLRSRLDNLQRIRPSAAPS